MSTTAVVSPYDQEAERLRNELAAREERALREFRQKRRASRVRGQCASLPPRSVSPLPKNQVTLGTGSLELVQQAAASLGYTPRPLSEGRVELVKQGGKSLVLGRSPAGRVMLIGPRVEAIQEVTREFTAQRVALHLVSRGMKVEGVKSADGEIVITGAEPSGPTKVVVDVRTDGVAVIDVDGVKGQGCQTILSGLSRELGGSQIDTARKPAFFQTVAATERLCV